MREQKGVGEFPIAGIEIRFAREDVETGRRDLAGVQCVDQCVVVHEIAARGIDDHRAVGQQRDAFASSRNLRVSGGRGQR